MKRFRFELEPLLRKHSWDIDLLRQEKIMAGLAVSEQQRVIDTIESGIRSSSESLIKASSDDAEISIAQRQLVSLYIKQQSLLAVEARASLENAEKIERQIADLLLSTSQQVKTLEKLRDNARRKHEHVRLRTEYDEADENWLASNRRIG